MPSAILAFGKIYDLWVDRSRERIPIIEKYLGIVEAQTVSADDRRNEPQFYRDVARENGLLLENCLEWLLDKLKAVPYEQAADIFAGVEFLQWIIADVLWRYGSNVSEKLERFTRDFDRLDVPDERLRLFRSIAEGT
jgi:hypothetical protein